MSSSRRVKSGARRRRAWPESRDANASARHGARVGAVVQHPHVTWALCCGGSLGCGLVQRLHNGAALRLELQLLGVGAKVAQALQDGIVVSA